MSALDYTKRNSFALPLVPEDYNAWLTQAGMEPYDRWELLGAELNPLRDINVEYLILKRYAIRRQRLIRDSVFNPIYWNHLPLTDRILAAAERDFWHDSEIHIRNMELRYLANEYLYSRELMDFTDPKFIESILKRTAENRTEEYHQAKLARIIEEQYSDQYANVLDSNKIFQIADYWRLSDKLIPPSHPGHAAYYAKLRTSNLIGSTDPLIPLPVNREQSKFLRRWRERGSPIQEEIHSSAWLLTQEFMDARRAGNKISGAAKNRETLLTDDSIPLPSVTTFMGWFSLSVLSFFRFTTSLEIGGKRYGAALTFIPPCLPEPYAMTQALAPLGATDPFADHTLNPRSVAHKRDANGRIDYGEKLAITVLMPVNLSDPYGIVACETLATKRVTALHCITHQLSMLPLDVDYRMVSSNQIPFLTYALMRHWVSWLLDPWAESPALLDPQWALSKDQPFDTGYRALSRATHFHLRFDSPGAMDKWIAAMVLAATEFLHMSPYERSCRMFYELAFRTSQIGQFSNVKLKSGGTTRFDLGGFRDLT